MDRKKKNNRDPKIMSPRKGNIKSRIKSLLGWVKLDPSSKQEKEARRTRKKYM